MCACRFPPSRRPVLVLAGPTASGKSALALHLADSLNAEIINADSMQVYDGLHVLTARPTPAEMARAPHRLYGVLPPEARCSAGWWRTRAVAALEAAWAAGRLPLVVGGTGLYLSALQDGLAAIPPVPAAVRRTSERLLDRLGASALRDLLAERTGDAAPPTDRQRLVRAWSVWAATGRSLGWWQARPTAGPPPGSVFLVAALVPERQRLYQRCDQRFEAMMAAGAEAEVAALLARNIPADRPVMKALGVPELAALQAGRLERSAAVALARQRTRQYAKRQMTWFRNRLRPDVVLADGEALDERARLDQHVRERLLTPGD